MIVFKFCQTYIETFLKFYRFQILACFFSSFSGCWVFWKFMTFYKIKAAKHIWEQCCHRVAETGSWFPLITKLALKGKCLASFKLFNSSHGFNTSFQPDSLPESRDNCMGGGDHWYLFAIEYWVLQSKTLLIHNAKIL